MAEKEGFEPSRRLPNPPPNRQKEPRPATAMSFATRLENNLKRADELIQSDQKQLALSELGATVSRKVAWSDLIEQTYKKYLELCIDLQKSSEAKFALSQCRSMTQSTNIKALDHMVGFFLDAVEQKVAEAERESTAIVDKFESKMEDEELWPENIMMAAVSGQDFKDRTDRQYVTPWLTFQWYAYRNVLDLLRTMAPLENRYHDTVSRALDFCRKNESKFHLRQLADALHHHLLLAQKISASVAKRQEEEAAAAASTTATADGAPPPATAQSSLGNRIDIQNYNTINLNIETRFRLLNTASELEIWQEAFKAIEDIFVLMKLSKKAPRTPLMIGYYEQLAKLFWVSKNYLLHAHSNLKLFELLQSVQRQSTDKSEDYESKIESVATAVVLSTISIPASKSDNLLNNADITELDFMERDKLTRLAPLLGIVSELPTRGQLISQLGYVASFAHASVRPLPNLFYNGLSSPFDFQKYVTRVLDFIGGSAAGDLCMYREPLVNESCIAVAEKLSQVYDVVRISEVVSLSPGDISQQKLESLIMESAHRSRDLQITVDHQMGLIMFGVHGSVGNTVFDSDSIRKQLTLFAKGVQSIARSVERLTGKSIIPRRSPFAPLTAAQVDREHKDFLKRKEHITKKKDWEAQEREKRDNRVANFRKELQEKREEEARKQREEEERIREELRAAREAYQEKINKAKLLIDKLASQIGIDRDMLVKKLAASAGTRIRKKHSSSTASLEDEAATVLLESTSILQTVESIMEAYEEEKAREKQQREKKFVDMIKSMDYMERARREVEARRIEEEFEKRKRDDRKLFEMTHQKEREKLEAKHKLLLEKQQYFAKMKDFKEQFVQRHVMSRRRKQFEEAVQQQQERKKLAREQWEARRKLIREEIARRKKQEEEEKARREKEEALRREREEKERQEQEEREAALRRQEEIQRKRMEEMEAKAEAARLAALEKESPAAVPQAATGRWGAIASETSRSPFGEQRGWRSQAAAGGGGEQRGWRSQAAAGTTTTTAAAGEQRGWRSQAATAGEQRGWRSQAPSAGSGVGADEQRGWRRPTGAGEQVEQRGWRRTTDESSHRGWRRPGDDGSQRSPVSRNGDADDGFVEVKRKPANTRTSSRW